MRNKKRIIASFKIVVQMSTPNRRGKNCNHFYLSVMVSKWHAADNVLHYQWHAHHSAPQNVFKSVNGVKNIYTLLSEEIIESKETIYKNALAAS